MAKVHAHWLAKGADIATQICAAKAYATEFNNKNACFAALQKDASPQVIVPSSGARHRSAKTKTGIEGAFVQKKKQKKSSVNKNIHIGLTQQLKEAECILAEKDVPIDCSPPCSQELPQENFSDCSPGCFRCKKMSWHVRLKYWNKIVSPLKDLVFCMQAFWIWRLKGQPEWQRCYGNVYFHLTISCFQSHNK